MYMYIYPITSGRRSDGFVSQEIQVATGGDCHHHQVKHITMYLYVVSTVV